MKKLYPGYKNIFIRVTIIFIFGYLSSCRTSQFLDPTTKFQKASSVVIASTRIYVTELNKTERDIYINSKAGNREQIKLLELENVQIFSKDGLGVRLSSLMQLERYCSLLLALSNSESAGQIKTNAASLSDGLTSLSKTVADLQGNDEKGSQFRNMVGPVTSILGEITAAILKGRNNEALQKAITAGQEPVNKLLEAIRNDMIMAYERKKNALSNQRVALVTDYDNERLKGAGSDAEKLHTYANRISNHEDRWEAFASSNPETGIADMLNAHNELVKFAKSPKKLENLSNVLAAMETFQTSAESLGQSLKSILKQ